MRGSWTATDMRCGLSARSAHRVSKQSIIFSENWLAVDNPRFRSKRLSLVSMEYGIARSGVPEMVRQAGSSSLRESRVIEQAPDLDEQAAGIGAGTAGHPADWCCAEERLECLEGKLDVGPLLILPHSVVLEPAIAVADEFTFISQTGSDEVGVASGRARDGERGDSSDVERTEEAEKAPATDPGAAVEDAFDDRAPKVRIRGKADIVECCLGGTVAFENAVFSATFDVEVDIESEAGVVGPSRM